MQINIQKLGFKCGVEIHQQLLTKKKLFCRCSAGLYSNEYHAEVLRHMRPTLSEMGKYDGCALMEYKTRKEIIYRLNKESVCTYEMDDTPPFLINQDALDIALEIALFLNCSIVDEVHIARKQYLDGSIPTGFQRSGVVGIGGSIKYKGRKIDIRQVSVEEDSCREVSDEGHTITFKTDRLGMPLIEVVTEAQMHTPEDVAGVIRQIGRLMRLTGKVRRGIGSVRQDVNVSIEGGKRVEIKGVSRYQMTPSLVYNEALRQKGLLEISNELKRRGITQDNLQVSFYDLNDLLISAKSQKLRDALDHDLFVKGVVAKKFNGILNYPTQPGKTFAHEISERVRVVACIDSLPNIYHTDSIADDQSDIDLIKRGLCLGKDDLCVLVWGNLKDVETAVQEIHDRFIEALDGVPNETRQPFTTGLTNFERILPGADRMYPDTDHPPIKITEERIKGLKSGLPETIWDLEERMTKWGMPDDAIDCLAISKWMPLIEKLAKEVKNIDMKTVGIVLSNNLKALKRKKIEVDNIGEKHLQEFFELYSKGEFKREIFNDILISMSHNPDTTVKNILTDLNIKPSKIEEAVNFSSGLNIKPIKDKPAFTHHLMGQVMKKFKGRIQASDLFAKL
ncbi:Glu-tRNA(Gln) amidotransferase subunit GatE [bacterium]|nr:Glu-tRNA(Gln) amidotransferase subunit GatE [bacterium]